MPQLFFPPIPPWDAIHVLIVHLPIGLLLLSPLLVLLGIFPGRYRAGMRLAALVVLVLGTAAAYVAVESGEAAAEVVHRTDEISTVLHHHSQMAQWVRDTFTGITIVYAIFFLVTWFMARLDKPAIAIPIQVLVLLAMTVGVLMVVDTGHLGGRLVHELGARASLQQNAP